MNWIEICSTDDWPPEGEYVLVKFDDDFVSITCMRDHEWQIQGAMKNPIFKGTRKFYTAADPQYWMPLPL